MYFHRRVPTYFTDLEEIISKEPGHVIATSACLGGQIDYLIMKQNENRNIEEVYRAYDDAMEKWLNKIISIFGKDNFYLELQPGLSDEQVLVNVKLLQLGRQHDIKCIVTTDSHYLKAEDRPIHKAFLNSKAGDREVDSFYEAAFMMTPDEIRRRLDYLDHETVTELLVNTIEIGDKCDNYSILKTLQIPYIPQEDYDEVLSLKHKFEPDKFPYFNKFFQSADKADTQLAIRLWNFLDNRNKVLNREKSAYVLEEELRIVWDTSEKMGVRWSKYFLQMADYMKVTWNEGDSITAPSRGCFIPESKVLLENGQSKEIKNIVKGDQVISHTGNINKVIDVLSYDVEEELIVVKAKGLEPITCTKDHKFYVLSSGLCNNPSYNGLNRGRKQALCKPKNSCPKSCKYRIKSTPQWIEAQNLKPTDMIYYPKIKLRPFTYKTIDLVEEMNKINKKNIDYNNKHIWITNGESGARKKINRYIPIDYSFNRFLGTYIGDGWSRKEGWVFGLAFHRKDDKENRDFCLNYINKTLGIEGHIREHKTKELTQVDFYSAIWAQLLPVWCGKNTYEKHIPDFLFQDNRDNITGLLHGLMAADGSYLPNSKYISICYDSVNYNLISQVKMLFTYLDCYGNISKRVHKEHPTWSDTYKWNASGKQLLDLKKTFPDINVPNQKYFRNDFIKTEEGYFSTLESIKPTKVYKGKVYDLTVANDSSYIINNCSVHNSAGASYLMYALDVIQIDKTREKAPLLFERFLNPDRASVLDVDTDVESTKRNKVISALQDRYGEDNVIRVSTFKTETSKIAIRDAARGLGIDNDISGYIASLIGSERGLIYTLDEMYYGNEEKGLKPNATFIREVGKYENLWETAHKIEGLVNGLGVHAGGVVITDQPIYESAAVMRTTKGDIITAFDLHDSEEVSLIKIDLLATKSLSKIRTCLDLLIEYGYVKPESTLRETYEEVIGVYNLDRDTREMWELVWNNDIIALFQMEQQSGIQGIALTKPESLEDLATLNSVIRLMAPERGMEQPLEKYARFRKNPQDWEDEMDSYGLDEEEKNLMKEMFNYSSGISAQQEDLYRLATHEKTGGMTLGEADQLRKAVAKKSGKDFAKFEEKYFKQVEDLKLSLNLTKYVWQQMVKPQAGYSFNLAHTLSYSVIALQEMNLAYYYPILFWNTANLIIDSGYVAEDDEDDDLEGEVTTSATTNYGKIASAVGNMQTRGVKVIPPSINKSNLTFTPDPETNRIIYGLKGISYVGDTLIEDIVRGRPYKSFADFHNKVKTNKRSMVNLIKSGAFNEFKPREEIMEDYIILISDTKKTVNLRNTNMLIQNGLIPDDYEMEKKVFNFNKYIKKFVIKDRKVIILDENAFPFYEKHFNLDLLTPLPDGTYEVKAAEWKKIYDGYMDNLRTYIKNNHDELLRQLNNCLTQDVREKYASGTIAQWSMDSVSFYQDEHELSNMDFLGNNIKKFYDLPREPIVERTFTTKQGYNVDMYELCKIAGTAIDRDKNKNEITLLCVDGVVTVKAYGVMPYYDKQISKVDSNGVKKVLEKSMFTRGNKIIVYGMRRGDNFFAKKYKNSPVSHHFTEIVKVNEDGSIETKERVMDE